MTGTSTAWDADADVVVVGSGGGGLMAAIVARDAGSSVLLLEKSARIGGATAISGGIMWIPNNALMKEAGLADLPEDALTYLERVTRGMVPKEKLSAFVREAPAMLDYLVNETHVRCAPVVEYPDYYPELAGGRKGGRSIEPLPFDGRRLGSDLDTLEEAHPMSVMFGRASVTVSEGRSMLFGGGRGALMAMGKLALFYLNALDRIRYRVDTRLTLGRALVGALRLSATERGVRILTETRARRLHKENGRVAGVLAEKDGREIRIKVNKAVILASGGFSKNPDLLRKYLTVPSDVEWTCAGAADEGDGILMGLELGASLGLMDEAWWMPMLRVPGREKPWLLMWERSLPGSIMVDRNGKRIANEAQSYIDFVKAMHAAGSTNGDYPAIPTYLIMDRDHRSKYPTGPLVPGRFWPESLYDKRYWETMITKAESLEELAADRLGIDAEGLRETVDEFNRHARDGVDPLFHRGESAYDQYYGDPSVEPNPCLAPLSKPPYYALRVQPGYLGTKGGLQTDEKARVLDQERRPIAGLFATGNTAASVMGPTYPGAGGTLGPALTFGYVAGKEAGKS